MKSMESSWKNGKDIDIFVQEWAPDGEVRAAIGLVHGLGEHTGRYHHVARWLTAAGYAMLGIDLPGHGRTKGPRGFTSFDEIGSEIDLLLSELEKRYPGKPRFLYGHSMGGAAVLNHVLARRPVLHGAIVTSPGLATGEPVPAAKIFLAKVMARLMPSFSMNNGLDLQNLSRDPAVIRAYQQDPLVHNQISARLGLDFLTRGDWILARAGEFPVPLLLMQGSADHIVSTAAVSQLASLIPPGKLTYKVWEGFYHETHNEPEQEQVLQTIGNWLDQQLEMVY